MQTGIERGKERFIWILSRISWLFVSNLDDLLDIANLYQLDGVFPATDWHRFVLKKGGILNAGKAKRFI